MARTSSGLAAGTPLPPGIAEIPDQFLLFRVDRDDRLTAPLEGPHPPVDVLELGVAIGMVVSFLGLAVGLQAVPQVVQQGGDGLVAHGMALAAQFLGQFPGALGGPAQGRLRIAAGGRFDQGLQGGEEGRVVVFDEMPAAARGPNSFGSEVVSGLVGAVLAVRVARPRWWCGKAGGRATRLTPPRPKDLASQAAHWRRSRSVISG